jgi:hypothetical protein
VTVSAAAAGSVSIRIAVARESSELAMISVRMVSSNEPG